MDHVPAVVQLDEAMVREAGQPSIELLGREALLAVLHARGEDLRPEPLVGLGAQNDEHRAGDTLPEQLGSFVIVRGEPVPRERIELPLEAALDRSGQPFDERVENL